MIITRHNEVRAEAKDSFYECLKILKIKTFSSKNCNLQQDNLYKYRGLL